MGGQAVDMDANVVDTAAQLLAAAGLDRLRAPLAELRVADLPDDPVGLSRLLGELEDARAAFDRRFAEGLDGAVGRLTAVVRDARAADTAPFMQGPKDGR